MLETEFAEPGLSEPGLFFIFVAVISIMTGLVAGFLWVFSKKKTWEMEEDVYEVLKAGWVINMILCGIGIFRVIELSVVWVVKLIYKAVAG
jgi:hypothetical protein